MDSNVALVGFRTLANRVDKQAVWRSFAFVHSFSFAWMENFWCSLAQLMIHEKTWLRRRYDAFKSVPPVFLDGLLFVLIAFFAAMLSISSSDDVYKYINAYVVFWWKTVCSVLLQCANALKMFRSTAYARHEAEQKIISGSTETITKTQTLTDDTKKV